MRVLLSCLQSLKRHPISAYDFWRLYFTKGCEEAGLDIVEVPKVDWAEALAYPPGKELDAWRARTWDVVLDYVRREHAKEPLDFFLSYLYPQQIEVSAIVEIQRLGIPCVNFFCDNVREFRRVPQEYQPFALHWVPEFEALSMYRRAGLPHLHAPMPCWVPPELHMLPVVESEPPTFIGSADVLRRDLLGKALTLGGNFVVRGPGWESGGKVSTISAKERGFGQTFKNQIAMIRQHGVASFWNKMENRLLPLSSPPVPDAHVREAVFGAEYFRITREAQITIGVNRVPTAKRSHRNPLTYSRLRDLEAPMLGACYLTEWTEGLEYLYELGKEIETYRTAEELCAKIAELRHNPARRQGLGERGQKRALADHSVARSLIRIRQKLGLS
jgi:Glycosyl transferases group 1